MSSQQPTTMTYSALTKPGNAMSRARGGMGMALAAVLSLFAGAAAAQTAAGTPPAVGVVRAERQQITQTDEFIGRIQAVNRVDLVARVTAFLEKREFVEGAEVK